MPQSSLPRARTWSTNGHATAASGEQQHHHLAPVTTDSISTSTSTEKHHHRQQQQHTQVTFVQHQHSRNQDGNPADPVVAPPSFLQPRVAALLGVSRRWHPVLFSLRLLSIVPAICLIFSPTIRFLLLLYTFASSERARPGSNVGEDRLLLTEMMLAIIWCGCSGYLSFFFTDCLMSRWLVHYTPSATAFRLVSVSALNGYLQSWTLHLSGSSQDPFLLLPTWITITSTLTLVYHITQRKINIRKETSISISVFSMASYISMIALLIQQHWDRSDWLDLPFIALACRILRAGGELVVAIAKYANVTVEH